MKDFRFTGRYKRDLKRINKRGYDLSQLNDVLQALAEGRALPPANRDHPLEGE